MILSSASIHTVWALAYHPLRRPHGGSNNGACDSGHQESPLSAIGVHNGADERGCHGRPAVKTRSLPSDNGAS